MAATALNQNVVGFDDVAYFIPEIENLTKQRRMYALPRGGRIIKTHERFSTAYRKGVYLVRNVEDVVVSYYFHQIKVGTFKGEFRYFVELFIKGRVDNYGRWDENVMTWLDAKSRWPERYLIVRYEDMVAGTLPTLEKVLDFFGISVSNEHLHLAVDLNGRSQMHLRESESKSLQLASVENIPFISRETDSKRRSVLLTPDLRGALREKFDESLRAAGYSV